MPKIFISYRRTDSTGITGRIYDRLVFEFGKKNLFMDIDTIPLGVDFRKYINEELSKCNVLLAIIGLNWFSIDDNGKRRIDQDNDFVRAEIYSALSHNILVIPVLIDGVNLPSSSELPNDLEQLAYLQGIRVDSGSDFHNHLSRLIKHLHSFTPKSETSNKISQENVDQLKNSPRQLYSENTSIAVLEDGTQLYYDPNPIGIGNFGHIFYTIDQKYVIRLGSHQSDFKARQLALITKYNVITDDSSWSDLFVWPQAIVLEPSLGVVFPAIDQSDLRELRWYMSPHLRKLLIKRYPTVNIGNFKNYLTIAKKMVEILIRLEEFNLVHSDLNPRSFLADAHSERIILIDPDALIIPGFDPPNILCTQQYMAPELIAQKLCSTPRSIPQSKLTVRHTTATLIYELLFQRHPLSTTKTYSPDDVINEILLLGEYASFIESDSKSVELLPGNGKSFTEVLTPKLQKLVERAFIDGLHAPTKRPNLIEWHTALLEACDSLPS